MRTRSLPYRFSFKLRFLYLACVIWLSVGVIACHANTVPSILCVHGCRDSDPPRDARQCFAHAASSQSFLRLSISTLNLTIRSNPGEEKPLIRVVLRESTAVPPLLLRRATENGMETNTTPNRSGSLRNPIEFVCENSTVSSALYSEVIVCDLPHPEGSLSSSLTEEVKDEQRRRLYSSPLWFDLFLERNSSKRYEVVGLLRHCVEVDLTEDFRVEKSNFAVGVDLEPTGIHLNRYPAHGRIRDPRPTQEVGDHSLDVDSVSVQLGIGGLQRELSELFRRVVLPRLSHYPEHLSQALGLEKVHGVFLYGPPGNGKTLLARAVARLLEPRAKLRIIKVRDMFYNFTEDGEVDLQSIWEIFTSEETTKTPVDEINTKDYDPHAARDSSDNSNNSSVNFTHVLVIDDFEELFQQNRYFMQENPEIHVQSDAAELFRSFIADPNRPRDLLIIALTTQVQAVNSLFLTHTGDFFFEVQIPITAPDAPAREKIFLALTRKLRDISFLPPSTVDFVDLARRTRGFSGADIASVVRAAVSHALLRQSNTPTAARSSSSFSGPPSSILEGGLRVNFKVEPSKPVEAATEVIQPLTREDFECAVREVRRDKAAAGFVSHELSEPTAEGGGDFIDYDGSFQRNWERVRQLISQVLRSRHVFSGVAVLTGGVGSGKTTITRKLAENAQNYFTSSPFATKFISCRRLVEIPDENERIRRVREAICAAWRSERDFIVLDDYDVLLDSFSNRPDLLGALKVLLYDFAKSDNGVDCSFGSEAAGSLGSLPKARRSRQFLILTLTSESALQGVPYDLHLRRLFLSFSDIQRLITHYRIANRTKLVRAIAQAYPSSLSYRHFIRLTDMALGQLGEDVGEASGTSSSETPDVISAAWGEGPKEEKVERPGEEKKKIREGYFLELPWFFTPVEGHSDHELSEELRNFSLADLRAKQERDNFFALSTSALAHKYLFILREVVGLAGLADPFAHWYPQSSATPGEGEDGVDEGDGTMNGAGIDAEGAGLEILW